jgi:hypothetical protein
LAKCEAKLNALPQFMTEIDGLNIHFIHIRSKHENAFPGTAATLFRRGSRGLQTTAQLIIYPDSDHGSHFQYHSNCSIVYA